jgi:hypothetical protein
LLLLGLSSGSARRGEEFCMAGDRPFLSTLALPNSFQGDIVAVIQLAR